MLNLLNILILITLILINTMFMILLEYKKKFLNISKYERVLIKLKYLGYCSFLEIQLNYLINKPYTSTPLMFM